MSSPIQTGVRTFFQQIWKGNQHWDRQLSLEDYPDVKDVFNDVAKFSTIHNKRLLFEACKQPVNKPEKITRIKWCF